MTTAPPSPGGAMPTPLRAAVGGCCPRCGKGRLFRGVVAFAPRCSACGLDYLAFNVGDGAASFLILIVGAIVTVAALVVDFRYAPPWWVHVMLWLPLTIGLTMAMLRVAKGLLLALEFRNEAREGRL